MMKNVWMALALVVAFALPLSAQGREDKFKVGDEAPEIVFSKGWNNGNKNKLSDFRGEWVHLIFWATW